MGMARSSSKKSAGSAGYMEVAEKEPIQDGLTVPETVKGEAHQFKI